MRILSTSLLLLKDLKKDIFKVGMGKGHFMNFTKFLVMGAVCAFASVTFAAGHVSYTLHKSANPTADEQEAYKLITAAMDSAMYYYNKYTNLSKYINVYYSTGVPTAEASSNGDLRFGKDRNYMYVGTAMHEIAHTMGMGTTSEYQKMMVNGVFQGQKAQALLREIDGADAELHGDSQHFWPYGINYRSEVHSEQDLINHAKIVNAMYQDIFKEAFYKTVRIMMAGGSFNCMGITSTNALELMDCKSEATIINLYTIGDNPVKSFGVTTGQEWSWCYRQSHVFSSLPILYQILRLIGQKTHTHAIEQSEQSEQSNNSGSSHSIANCQRSSALQREITYDRHPSAMHLHSSFRPIIIRNAAFYESNHYSHRGLLSP